MHFFGHGRKIQKITSASDASQNATWWQMYSLIEKETYHVRSWSDNLSTKCWKPWEHPLKHLLVRLERVSVKSSPNHIPQVKLSSSQIGPNRWRHSCITFWRLSALALCYSAAEYCAPVWSRSAHTSQVDVQLNSTMHLISGTLRSTPLPWLPVLSNIEPYEGRLPLTSWWRKSSNMTVGQSSLISRKPLWLDLQPVDIKSRWRHNWKSAQVVNSYLVCDPTIRQPGFDRVCTISATTTSATRKDHISQNE